MKILIIANHYAVASGRYMTDAFKRLGHDVRHIGPAHGRSIWGMDVDAKYVWEPDADEGANYPDLIVVMDSDPAILDSSDVITWAEYAPMVVYGVDNHVRDYRRLWFDHYFLAHRGVSVMEWGETRPMSDLMQQQIDTLMPTMKRDDPLRPNFPSHVAHSDMTWLPCGYDPTLFTPSQIPYEQREFDVAMIGVMYPQRWQLVNELRAAGLKVLAGTGLIYEDYRDAYHNARISLCASIAGDVAQRVFETAAMGCLVVSDDCADFERLDAVGIAHGVPTQIVGFCKAFAHDEESAQMWIAKSLEWVRPHTWDARAQTIIDWLQKRQAGEAAHEHASND